MPIIHRLIRLHIGVKIISDKDDILQHLCCVQALPDHLQHQPHPPVHGLQVLVGKNWFDRIRGERPVESSGQKDRTRVVREQHGGGGVADDTTLDMDRSTDVSKEYEDKPDREEQGWTSRHD